VFQNKQYILTADIHYQFHKITCGKWIYPHGFLNPINGFWLLGRPVANGILTWSIPEVFISSATGNITPPTQKITRGNNPPIKATLFWSRYESKRVTGTGHYACTSSLIQEAGKTTDALDWQHQGGYRPTFGSFKWNSTR
jgi:hypothetical protein